ncbi:MAG: sugar phosphate nucleotidyltransferase [Pseudomonadota bacterium]
MMTKPTLIIMAAGLGSRYGNLKQMDPVGPGGELIIEYSIYDALRCGFGKIVFVINKEIEDDFREIIGNTIDRQGETAYVFQSVDDLPEHVQIPADRAKPWGTGQAVLLCQDEVEGSCAVINADDFYGLTSFLALHHYLVKAEDLSWYDYCMVGFTLENTLTEHGHVSRGICSVDEDGYLIEIHERTHVEKFGDLAKHSEDGGKTWVVIPEGSIVSMNMWGFTHSIFGELETGFDRFFQEAGKLNNAEFYLPEVVGKLVKEQKARVRVLPTNERWVGMTYREDKLAIEKYIAGLIEQGVYPENLWE